jgi:hypothetical protein
VEGVDTESKRVALVVVEEVVQNGKNNRRGRFPASAFSQYLTHPHLT